MRNDNASLGPCALTCRVVRAGEQYPPAETMLPFPPIPLQRDALLPTNAILSSICLVWDMAYIQTVI